jgi:DNA (cytosine-5)-methyltransferase 1
MYNKLFTFIYEDKSFEQLCVHVEEISYKSDKILFKNITGVEEIKLGKRLLLKLPNKTYDMTILPELFEILIQQFNLTYEIATKIHDYADSRNPFILAVSDVHGNIPYVFSAPVFLGTYEIVLTECSEDLTEICIQPTSNVPKMVLMYIGDYINPGTLEEIGYRNYWQVLNAKDYGVPQNRERVFVVSIRKDLNQTYMFPEPVPLTLKLKDMLESEVDEKYYLPQEKVEQLVVNLNKDVSNTVRCGGGNREPCVIEPLIAVSRGRNPDNPSCRDSGIPTIQMLEVNESGCSNTLTTVQKDNLVMCVPINTCTDGTCQALTAHLHKETANDCTKFERHSPATGVLEVGVGHNPISKKFEFDGFHDQPAPTLLATDYKAPKCYSDGMRIRKLTPRECWRLMGVKDEQFDRLHGISKTQLYKMAGNSIVVDVLMAIFKNLLISDKETKGQLSLF